MTAQRFRSAASRAQHYGNRRHRPTPTAYAIVGHELHLHYADGSTLRRGSGRTPADLSKILRNYRAEDARMMP